MSEVLRFFQLALARYAVHPLQWTQADRISGLQIDCIPPLAFVKLPAQRRELEVHIPSMPLKQREKVSPVKKRKAVPLIVALLLLAAAAGLLLLNRWQLRLELRGEEDCTLEYGEPYREPGAEAVFGGRLFLPALAAPEVRIRGTVDPLSTGDYTLSYSAECLWFTAERSRLVHVRDTVPPVITLAETPWSYTLPGSAYEEEGYSAADNADGDLTARVERREEGGIVRYTVTDSSGNSASAERIIRYDDPIPPELLLLGETRLVLPYGTAYEEPGYVARDNLDGDLNAKVTVAGEVDPMTPGDYTLRYTVEDSWHNGVCTRRIVTVEPKPEPRGYVYLTFDDGPSKHTQRLLDILDRYGVKVTFFVVNYGLNDMIGKEAAAGHSIGIHSATHDYYTIYASEEAYFADLDKMNGIIYAQTGAYSDILRFPGGSSNTVSSFNPGIMTRLASAVEARGYAYFDWNVNSGDAGSTNDPDEIYRNVIEGIEKHEYSVVLMHDSRGYTVDTVERILIWCLENNYALLPLDHDSPGAHHRIGN